MFLSHRNESFAFHQLSALSAVRSGCAQAKGQPYAEDDNEWSRCWFHGCLTNSLLLHGWREQAFTRFTNPCRAWGKARQGRHFAAVDSSFTLADAEAKSTAVVLPPHTSTPTRSPGRGLYWPESRAARAAAPPGSAATRRTSHSAAWARRMAGSETSATLSTYSARWETSALPPAAEPANRPQCLRLPRPPGGRLPERGRGWGQLQVLRR